MMSNEMRFVMLTKLSIAMIVALFSLALPSHAQRRTPASRQSDSKASRAVSAKALAVTGKGCAVGFNEMYYSTDVFDDASNVIEFCGPAWAVAVARGAFREQHDGVAVAGAPDDGVSIARAPDDGIAVGVYASNGRNQSGLHPGIERLDDLVHELLAAIVRPR